MTLSQVEFIYKVELEEPRRKKLAEELYSLRMKVGMAAKAVIEDNPVYIRAVARLKIGKYDLAKLGGISLTLSE
ncbi:hypothetical protein HZA40_01890 [Candidatus Peregrinibacteria bacterium]|nr:hypothetical protein [Candidatus Peregrinibacteria bacterium]